jgi:DNA invertase Pin-like site-specific DNA recombinase
MKYISYVRVSTTKQEVSGLGIESQKEANLRYINQMNGKLLCELVEITSGGYKERISLDMKIDSNSLLKKRPVLKKAVHYAKETGAIIVVKQLDRLSRYSLFVNYLIDLKDVRFVVADSPNDDSMMLKMRAAWAEEEAKKISMRTKAALELVKKNGSKSGKLIGNHTTAREARITGKMTARQSLQKCKKTAIDTRRANAYNENIQRVYELTRELRVIYTYSKIAEIVNNAGFRTNWGKPFTNVTISRYCKKTRQYNREQERKPRIMPVHVIRP